MYGQWGNREARREAGLGGYSSSFDSQPSLQLGYRIPILDCFLVIQSHYQSASMCLTALPKPELRTPTCNIPVYS
jgi:hypothetical protein